jgi:hypothetical protein
MSKPWTKPVIHTVPNPGAKPKPPPPEPPKPKKGK